MKHTIAFCCALGLSATLASPFASARLIIDDFSTFEDCVGSCWGSRAEVLGGGRLVIHEPQVEARSSFLAPGDGTALLRVVGRQRFPSSLRYHGPDAFPRFGYLNGLGSYNLIDAGDRFVVDVKSLSAPFDLFVRVHEDVLDLSTTSAYRVDHPHRVVIPFSAITSATNVVGAGGDLSSVEGLDFLFLFTEESDRQGEVELGGIWIVPEPHALFLASVYVAWAFSLRRRG